jgi:hypothetical protein
MRVFAGISGKKTARNQKHLAALIFGLLPSSGPDRPEPVQFSSSSNCLATRWAMASPVTGLPVSDKTCTCVCLA